MTQCPPNDSIRLPLSGRFSPLPLTFPTKSVQPGTTPMAALRSFYMFPKNKHPSWALWYISKSCTIFESCMIYLTKLNNILKVAWYFESWINIILACHTTLPLQQQPTVSCPRGSFGSTDLWCPWRREVSDGQPYQRPSRSPARRHLFGDHLAGHHVMHELHKQSLTGVPFSEPVM